jgi:hypothetical protein
LQTSPPPQKKKNSESYVYVKQWCPQITTQKKVYKLNEFKELDVSEKAYSSEISKT